MPTRSVTTLSTKEFPVALGNFDTNRAPVSLIVIHTEDGFKTGTRATFATPNIQRSAHYAVNLDGSIDHFLEETLVAYHAANYQINQCSIGIEHEDDHQPNSPRPDILYSTSARLVADICKFYQIPCDRTRIKKHSEVAKAEMPTSCPDSLDIDRIIREANSILIPAPTPTPASGIPVPQVTLFQANAGLVIANAMKTNPRFVSLSGVPFGNEEGAARELVDKWPDLISKSNIFTKIAALFGR